MAQILVELIKMANLFITITKSLACADRVAAVMQLDTAVRTAAISCLRTVRPAEVWNLKTYRSNTKTPERKLCST